MLKRQKRIRIKPTRDNKEKIVPIDTPRSDAKLRLLLSGFSHDNRFLFKAKNEKLEKSFSPSPEPEHPHDLSLQLCHCSYRPSLSPEILRTNFTKISESSPGGCLGELLRNTSDPNADSENSFTSRRRKACLLNPSILPKAVPKSTKKKLKLRDMVRRKSCCCSECGGLSKLEKKIPHIIVKSNEDKAKLQYMGSNASMITGDSPSDSSLTYRRTGFETRSRKTTVPSINSLKKQSTCDFLLQPLGLETRARNKTYCGTTNLPGVSIEENLETLIQSKTDVSSEIKFQEALKHTNNVQNLQKSMNSQKRGSQSSNKRENNSRLQAYDHNPVNTRAKYLNPLKIHSGQNVRAYSKMSDGSCPETVARKCSASEIPNSLISRETSSVLPLFTERPGFRNSSITGTENEEISALEVFQIDNIEKISFESLALNKMQSRENIKSRASSLPRLSNIIKVRSQNSQDLQTKVLNNKEGKQDRTRERTGSIIIGQKRLSTLEIQRVESTMSKVTNLSRREVSRGTDLLETSRSYIWNCWKPTKINIKRITNRQPNNELARSLMYVPVAFKSNRKL